MTSTLCQTDLFLTLCESTFLLFCVRVITARTGNPWHIMRRQLVSVSYGEAAGKTLIVTALIQIVIDRNPAIKYKAFAFPASIILWSLLKVIEDTTFQMPNVFEPHRDQK